MSLPGSGTIRLSEIKTEFGKGNNLLAYLGEGGVTGSAPLKLTDFYGTSAGPQVPTGPIHAWNGRTHNEAGADYQDSVSTTIARAASANDLIIQGAAYTYGLNNNPGSVLVTGSEYNRGYYRHTESIGLDHPLRASAGFNQMGTVSELEFTFRGSGGSSYWPAQWLGCAFHIRKSKVPFNMDLPIGSTVGTDVNVNANNARPNTIALGYLFFQHDQKSVPSITGGEAVIGYAAGRHHGIALAYQYCVVDDAGFVETQFNPAGGGIHLSGLIYERNTRMAIPPEEPITDDPDWSDIVLPTPKYDEDE